MTIGLNQLTTGTHNGSAASQNTASVSPGVGRLILVSGHFHSGAGSNDPVPSVTGNGLTYANIFWNPINTGFSFGLWRGMLTSTNAGVINFNFGVNNQDAWAWAVDEFTGVSTSGSNGAGAVGNVAPVVGSGGVSTISTTLAGVAAGNASFGTMYCHDETAVLTAGAGYTIIDNVSVGAGTNVVLGTEWDVNGSTTINFSSNNVTTLAIGGIEIVAQAVTPPPVVDTFSAAWSSQGTLLIPGPPRLTDSGSFPGTRVP